MGVIQASVSDMTVPEERSKMMGRLGAAYGLGFIFGPVLGGWASHRYGFAMPMFITAGLSFFNVLLLLFFLPEPTKGKVRKTEQKTSLLMLWKHVDRKNYMAAVLAFFFFLLGFSMVMTLLALFFYHRYGVNELQAGYVYATLGIVAIIVEGGLFGVLSKKWGDRRLARAGAFLLVIAAFFLPLTMSIMIAVGVCVMFALGDSLLTPALPAIVSRSAQEEWHGAAFGFYQSAGCLGRCFGPLIAGLSLAVNLQGPHYALTSFWIASGFLLLSFFFSTRLPS